MLAMDAETFTFGNGFIDIGVDVIRIHGILFGDRVGDQHAALQAAFQLDPESVRRIRSKLTPDIFELIFKEFTKKLRTSPDLKPLFRTMFGFLLYCVDGSDINLPFNKDDEETLCTNGKGRKPYNQIHLNAIYDCLNGFYVACNFRGTKKTGQGERRALYELLQEFTGNRELVLQANNPQALVKMIKWASTAASLVSAPASRAKEMNDVDTSSTNAPLVLDMNNIPDPADIDADDVW